MSPVGFEPTISAGERPQTHALDRAATGTGSLHILHSLRPHEVLNIGLILGISLSSKIRSPIWFNVVRTSAPKFILI